jgi:hypothetical protein
MPLDDRRDHLGASPGKHDGICGERGNSRSSPARHVSGGASASLPGA